MNKSKNILLSDLELDRASLKDVFSASLGRALVVQGAMAEKIGTRDWDLNFRDGQIRFDGDVYRVNFIGSESAQSHTWMWGWNNINHFPDEVVAFAGAARDFGEKYGLEEFKNPQLQLNDINNGLILSVVACNLSDENYCYYRVEHDAGVIWVAFTGFESPEGIDAPRFTSLVLDSLQKYELNHRLFILGFLNWLGVDYDDTKSRIVAKFAQSVAIDFDDFGRIISMEMK